VELTYGFKVAPGQCFSCGQSDPAKPAFDFGLMPGAGGFAKFRIYICGDCITAAASKLTEGEPVEVDPDDVDALRERDEQAERKLEAVKELL